MNISDFFSNNAQTLLINRMCALLQINDTSRVKIVGVYNGSVQVVIIITPAGVQIVANSTVNSTAQTAAI